MIKVAVIGTGRVGLPLALALRKSGAFVAGVDISPDMRRTVNDERRMPFLEPGFDELVKDESFKIYASLEECPEVDYYIVTVGTPLLQHIETDLSAVTAVITQLCKKLRKGQTVISRSTTAPGTTTFIRNLIETKTTFKIGDDIGLACCPERIVEGKAMEEMFSLPQIVGTQDEYSKQKASELFGLFKVDLLHCDYTSAELVKLFNNVSRYTYFATANALAMIAMEYGAEPYQILKMANHKYPRPLNALPGFTAGTCLRKDFGMLSESYWSGNVLVESWRINESLPKFLVESAKLRAGSLMGKRIAVLGYTFKRDTDDTRDSLVPKLIRYLARETPSAIVVHDPFITKADLEKGTEVEFSESLEATINKADLLFLATNHSMYLEKRQEIIELAAANKIFVVDIWNALKTDQVFIN